MADNHSASDRTDAREQSPREADEPGLPEFVPPGPGEPGYEAWTAHIQPQAEPDAAFAAAKAKLSQQLLFSPTARSASERGAATSAEGPLGFENIVGVSIGEKQVAGSSTGQPAIVVQVYTKDIPDRVAPEALVPETIDGFATDVVVSGGFILFADTTTYRPIRAGASVGHYRSVFGRSGTLGALVKKGGRWHILGNNHILAPPGSALGDAITQPSVYDGGSPSRDAVATLTRRVPFTAVNRVDCAIARVNDNVDISRLTKCLPIPMCNSYHRGSYGLPVTKCGAGTGFTFGKFGGWGWDGKVRFSGTDVYFENQLVIDPDRSLGTTRFAYNGDSGAMVVVGFSWAWLGCSVPVGLVIGGDPSRGQAFVSPILAVAEALGGFSFT